MRDTKKQNIESNRIELNRFGPKIMDEMLLWKYLFEDYCIQHGTKALDDIVLHHFIHFLLQVTFRILFTYILNS